MASIKPYRPKLKVKLQWFDYVIELLAFAGLVACWVVPITFYANLPSEIPVHFNAQGEPDRWGHKSNLWILPIMTLVLYSGLTILNRYPHVFNFPVTLNEGNALHQYTLAVRMVRVLKLAVVSAFTILAFGTIETAMHNTQGIDPMTILPGLAGLFVYIGVYLWQASKAA